MGRVGSRRCGGGRNQKPGRRRGEDLVIRLGAGRLDRIVAVGAATTSPSAPAALRALCHARPGVRIDVLVLSGGGSEREQEEQAALTAFCPGADLRLTVHKLPDGRLPAHWDEAKAAVEELRGDGAGSRACPRTDDAHQDHRGLAKLMTTAFRDHLVLGYEIVEWDGDLGHQAAYQPLSPEIAEQKVRLLQEHYPRSGTGPGTTGRPSSGWPRIRGIESHARYAEAFAVTKLTLDLGE